MKTEFIYRFPTVELKKKFQIHCIEIGTSMNSKIGDLILSYLEEQRELDN